jgi:hypothetical protein
MGLFNHNGRGVDDSGRPDAPNLEQDAYGFFGVLYSASFWNGFQMVS